MNNIRPIKIERRQFAKPCHTETGTGVTSENLFDSEVSSLHSIGVNPTAPSEEIEPITEAQETSAADEQTIAEPFKVSEKSFDIELDQLEEIFGPAIHIADHYHTLCEGRDYLLPTAEQPHTQQKMPRQLRKIFESIRLVTHLVLHPEPAPLKQYFRGVTSYWAPVNSNSTLLAYIKIFLEDPEFDTDEEYHCEHFQCVADAYSILKPYRDQLNSVNLSPNANLIEVDKETGSVTETPAALKLNQFAKRLDENCNAYQFKEAQRNRDRQVNAQFSSATKYINRLRQHNGRLLVIRVDLHLPANKKDMVPAELGKHFFDFLHILRRKQDFHLKGYLWKLEYGAQQSFHYHCLFFLDGRKHAQDIRLAQFIGEIWDKVIGGKNCYFNCHHHKHKNKFQYPVMGRLEPYDDEKYQRLFLVIRYFCKKDQFIVHRNCKGKKTLGMGQVKNTKNTHTSV